MTGEIGGTIPPIKYYQYNTFWQNTTSAQCYLQNHSTLLEIGQRTELAAIKTIENAPGYVTGLAIVLCLSQSRIFIKSL